MVKKFNRNKCHSCNNILPNFMVALIILGVTNIGGEEQLLCVGDYKCNVGNKTMVFIVNGIYILFWTFILDLM